MPQPPVNPALNTSRNSPPFPPAVEDWEAFTIGSNTYLAVANSGNGTTPNISSKIYRWNGMALVDFLND